MLGRILEILLSTNTSCSGMQLTLPFLLFLLSYFYTSGDWTGLA